MTQGKSKISDEQINAYQDPSNIAPKNLKIGLWIANNRRRLYRLLVVFLGLIALVSVVYALFGFVEYNTIGREREKTLLYSSGGVDISDYREQNRPEDLRISTPRAIASTDGADLTVRLGNSNDKQYALFDFCFISGEDEACGQDFILPQEQKDIFLLNTNLEASADVRFVINHILWQKIKAYEVPDWSIFRAERLNFEIADAKFTTYSNDVSYLEFTIENNTAFGYFSVPLDIMIRQGDRIMAVNRYVIYDFLSRSTREIRLLWPEGEARGGSIEIVPVLNILSDAIYKPYSATDN